jgi:arylsulfatase A
MANGFGDFVVQTDAICGEILKALEDHCFAENTIVIFSSDNGPEAYAFERTREYGHDSAGSLRGLKRDLYEGGHRVPFVVRWPKKVSPGSVHDGLVSQVDLMATFAALVGVDLLPGQAEDSHNQLAAWTEGQPSARTEIVHNTFAGAYAIRQGPWVLILNSASAQGYAGSHHRVPDWYAKQKGYRRSEGIELYHLASDPGQMKDLHAKHPEKLQHLKARLQAIQAKGQVR